MDIYVVSNVWDREGSTIIGAGVTLDDAQQIAMRLDGMPELRGEWTPWVGRPAETSSVPSRDTWERQALWRNGEPHPSFSQEIVVVPLAGMVMAGELPASLAGQLRQWAAGQPATYELNEIEEIGRHFGAP